MNTIGLGGIGAVSKRSKKDIDLIYKHTDRDFKSNSNGIKKVLYLDKKFGTVLSPIKSLPNDVYITRLNQAKRKEAIGGIGATKKQKEVIFIEFLNKDKNFTKDRKNFKSYDSAVKWGRKNFENFNLDMIRYRLVD